MDIIDSVVEELLQDNGDLGKEQKNDIRDAFLINLALSLLFHH